MCGIVAYLGNRSAAPILINGLKRLEYRGYDSAGIALLNGGLKMVKKAGKVAELESLLLPEHENGSLGIGHTRWATHGPPNDANAHPHLSGSGDLAIIHNGIIENHATIKEELIARGHSFESDTDTEVLVHLIEELKTRDSLSLEEAVITALNEVVGAYAIVVISRNDPGQMVAARKGSPMVLGIGDGEYFVASDATPIVEYTRNVVYLNDHEVATITKDDFVIRSLKNHQVQSPSIHQLEINLEALEKGGYEHFMLKEIHEQPKAILDTLRGRFLSSTGEFRMSGLNDNLAKFLNAKRIVFVACGTSWHAGLVGEYLLEEFSRIPVEVEYASEFRYRDPIITQGDIIIAISQSGETADTLAAIEMAKKKGATIFGICNVVGSSIPRMSHAGAYTHAGPEIGVASTKAFTAQVTVLAMMAAFLGKQRGHLNQSKYFAMLYAIERLPEIISETLKVEEQVIEIAKKFIDSQHFLYLGRGVNFPVALEGALKLKEISYIHAEGYPAAEMKHGPIALIDENMPVVVIATNTKNYDKVLSNIQEVKARKGQIISIVNKRDAEIESLSDYVIEVPDTEEFLMPIVSSIPLQFLAYHIAVLRGCNVDQPRNLAKSVTVE